MRTLSENGYRENSSIQPFYEEKDLSFAQAPTRPYWPSFDQVTEPEASKQGIFEVPSTSGYTRKEFEQLDKIRAKLSIASLNKLRLVGTLSRLGLMRKIKVTSEGYVPADICRCIHAGVAAADGNFNIFFHSSDLLLGCTPYVGTEAEKQRFVACLRMCMEHVRHAHNATFLTMRDIRQYMTGTA